MPSWRNISEPRPTFVSHLECGLSGEVVPADQLHGLSAVGRPYLVRYDLPALARGLSKETLANRPPDLWRYREFLPVRENRNIVSLGECMTPLIPAPGVQGDLWIKDEGRLPTGSFKARGLCLAVSMAKELGVRRMAMPTNGNAGAAMAAYCRAAGIEAFVFCPDDTPQTNIREIALQGARVYCVNGLINDCGKIVGDGKEAMNWFDASTLKEPYRIEGKKTMGLELAEQCGWQLPDAIFYPTGGGTGLIGMWKAFDELEAIGWIGSKRPKMIAVQASGCAPIVKAFDDGVEHAELWPNAHTMAAGIRVPAAVGDFLILRAVRQSGGFAIAIDDDAIFAARDHMAQNSGLLLCPEGAATYAAWQAAVADGRIDAKDRSILFNCATGLKYPMPAAGTTLDRHQPIDYGAMA
ncbi:MAG: threonine synthase [Alphaproteobacteria bacterium]|nr:threonine synthase [Alphaproteobacteria bacterium]